MHVREDITQGACTLHMKSASGTPALSNLLELFTDRTASQISQGQEFALVLQIIFCNSYMDECVYIQIDVTKSMLSWQETKLSFLVELPIWLHGTYLTITGRRRRLTLPLNILTSPTVCSKFKTMTSFIFSSCSPCSKHPESPVMEFRILNQEPGISEIGLRANHRIS